MDLVEIADKMTVRRTEEHHAHGLALPAELDGTKHLVIVFIDKVDNQRMRGAREKGLQMLDHTGKQLVGRTLDNDEYGVGALLLLKLCAFVEFKAAFLRNGQNRLPRFIRNIRLVIEHARDRTKRITAQSRKILDRQIC